MVMNRARRLARGRTTTRAAGRPFQNANKSDILESTNWGGAAMQSPTGDQFRDTVANLLRAAGMRVRTEVLISGKKVDVLAETTSFGLLQQIAVECKYRKTRVGIGAISSEVHEYSTILADQKNGVDRVLFITDKEFTTAAREHVLTDKRISILTFSELQAHLLNIVPYLRALVADFERAGEKQPYVPLRSSNGALLEEVVEGWLSSPNDRALAIVAGYGRGKTTFAKRFAAHKARRALDDLSQRLPILISLSDLEHSVRLSGVITDTIADRTLVERFSHALFRELNALGRFIIILDGFDEMKHGLDFEQFRSLFQQITDLVEGDSKVLLLGRPSAFMSDTEELAILPGGDSEELLPESGADGFGQFSKTSIDFFTVEEGQVFVRNYAHYCSRTRGRKHDAEKGLDARVDKWLELVDKELLTRPVHARMLGDLATEKGEKPRVVNQFSLYDYFVHATIARESKKVSRDIRISPSVRRQFVREIAWWSWTTLKRVSFEAANIPEAIFETCTDTIRMSKEVAHRELIVSSMLDRKSHTEPKLAFLHRSMQEFLVAEYMLLDKMSPRVVAELAEKMTPELIRFLISGGTGDALRDSLHSLIGGGYRKFHINFLRLYVQAIREGAVGFSPRPIDAPFQALVELFCNIGGVTFEGWSGENLRFATSKIQSARERQSAAIFAMLLIHMFSGNGEHKRKVLAAILKRLAAKIDFEKVDAVLRRPGVRLAQAKKIDVTTRAFLLNISRRRSEKLKRDQIWVDVPGIYEALLELSPDLHTIGGLPHQLGKYRVALNVEQFSRSFGQGADRSQVLNVFEHAEFKAG
jgi:hypothetical protein